MDVPRGEHAKDQGNRQGTGPPAAAAAASDAMQAFDSSSSSSKASQSAHGGVSLGLVSEVSKANPAGSKITVDARATTAAASKPNKAGRPEPACSCVIC